MKLCYIAPPNNINTIRWIKYFARRGHEVHLIATGKVGNYYEDVDLKVHQLVSISANRGLEFAARVSQVRKIIKSIRPELLHCHYITNNGYLGALSGFQPLVLTAWGSDIYVTPANSKFFYLFTQYTLRRAKLITGESKDILRRVEVMRGCHEGQLAVIQWGVDLNVFRPGLNATEVRQDLGLLGNDPIVFSSRKFKPNYNHDVVIRSIPLVLREMPMVKFIFKNPSGEQRESLELLAKSVCPPHSYLFIGEDFSYDQIPIFNNMCDIMISIPTSDSVSISMLEAMACGIPVIVSDLPSTREWVEDGVNGLIVPPRSPESLANAIIRLLTDSELRDRIVAKNLALVRDRADHFKEMAKVENLYAEICYDLK